MATAADLYTALEQAIPAVREACEQLLGDLVQIPTISMDPAHAADIQRGAQKAADRLRACGAEVQIVATPGYPVVCGRLQVDPRYPTVAIENHLDVQPAHAPQWHHAPCVFRRAGERYLGRGTTDDTGPALTALMAARFAAQHGVPLHCQFLWEREEDIGSPHWAHFVEQQRQALTWDSVVISDTVWLSRTTPAVPYGLRGMLTRLFRLESARQECHAGVTGGAARHPVGELAALIAQCYDARTGRGPIPGFYDGVRPLPAAELENFLGSGFQLATFMEAHGFHKLRTDDVATVVRSIWREPTFEVHGSSGGYQGPGIKTMVPHAAEAKLSMRLVPEQEPERLWGLVQSFLRQHNPDVEVVPGGFLRPYLGEFGGFYGDAVRQALRFGFHKEACFTREGGSIGAVVTLDQLLRVPVVFLGLSLPEHGYHAPNENFDWGQASGGMRAFVKYFELLAGRAA